MDSDGLHLGMDTVLNAGSNDEYALLDGGRNCLIKGLLDQHFLDGGH